MTPRSEQLLTGYGIALLGLLIIASLVVLAKSNWATKKKVIGGVVFLLGFLPIWGTWTNIAPYFFSKNSVIGKVISADCSGDIQQYSDPYHYPDCNYQVTYNLDNKQQVTTVNSMSNSIVLSQGQSVAVYYKKDNAGNYTLGFGNVGDNKNFLSYLFSHLFAFMYTGLAILFFFVGLKLMGLISKEQADKFEAATDDIIRRNF